MTFSEHVEKLIDLALEEDIGPGDVTTRFTVAADAAGQGVIIAKEALIIAGLDVARHVFQRCDPQVHLQTRFQDGDPVEKGQTVASLSGLLTALLTAERTALNFLQRLSGIATKTHRYAALLKGKKARLLDTRKTTPGWRELEKYAVRVGGGTNHRMGLYDAVLIKDNHIVASGGITAAVSRIKAGVKDAITIEVETTSLDEVREALDAGAHIIMLDNMDIDRIRSAVELVAGRAKLEVSGGITREHLIDLADTGIDYISSGALTHSARAVDLSMRIVSA